MPDFTDYAVAAPAQDFGAMSQATPQEFQQAAQASGPGDAHPWYTTLAGDIGLGALDLVDTVQASIPGLSRVTGLGKGAITNKALAAMDMPGLTDFYNQNRGGIGIASTVEGIAAAAYAGGQIAKVAAPLFDALKTVPYAGRLLSLEDSYQTAMASVRAADSQLAATGITGSEAWSATLAIPTVTADAATGATGSGFLTSTRAALANRASGLAFGKGAVNALGQEAVMATFLNQNEYLYSDDVGQNLMWMGLGVTVGGAFNVLGAGYQMRKFANSDALQRLKAAALDPTGQEAARTQVVRGDPTQADKTFLGSLQGWATDRVTSFMTSAKAAPAEGVDAKTFGRLSTQHQQLAFNEATKATSRGLPNELGTAFDANAAGYWNHLSGGLDKDPALLYGVEMLGGISDDATVMGTHQNLTTKMNERFDSLRQALADHDSGTKVLDDKARANTLLELKNLRFQRELTPQVLIDQEPVPLSIGASYDNFANPAIQVDKDLGHYEAFDAVGRSHGVAIDTAGTITLPKDASIQTADHFDVLRLYRAANKMMNDVAKQVGDPKFVWSIPDSIVDGKLTPSWFHLDMAEQLMKDTQGRINIDWGRFTPASAQKESLIQKVTQLKSMDLAGMTNEEMQKLRVRFNLPRLTSYQMGVLGTQNTPLDTLIRGAASMPESDLRAMSVGDLKQTYADMNNIGDLAKTDASQVKTLAGNSFKFMLDDEGNPVKPILMYKRNIAPMDYTQDTLAERIGAKKTAQAAMLVGGQSGPMTRELVGGMLANPDYQLGARTTGLHDTQIASSIPGLANVPSQTGTGSILNSVVSAEWRARDNPVILAVTRLREGIGRQMLGFMQDTVKSAMGDSVATINGPRNLASKTLLDNFHTFRSGWDLEARAIPVVGERDGLSGFVLSDTVGNQKRFQQQYGRPMPKGQQLLDSSGKPVVLDQLGIDAQTRFNQVTDALRVEKNSLLAAKGLPQISRDSWYVPPQDLTGKYIGFTRDISGNTIPGGTIVANTQQQFDAELARMKADPTSAINSTPGAKFAGRDEIAEYNNVWDKAQMEMMNPGTTATQGQKESRGFLTGPSTQVNRFDESMRTMRDNFLSHGNDIMTTMLDDQIKAAQQRATIAGVATRNADSKQLKYRSIYDYWLEAAQGRSPIQSNGSAVGWLYNGAETRFNDVMREVQPKANRVWAAATDWLTKSLPWSSDAKSISQFKQLSDALGEHMPFESAADMLERKGMGQNPFKLADITGRGNSFTATWMLRMLEPASAIMNLSGIINAMPSVIRHISAREGESALDVASRVGQNANIFTSPDGTVFSALDMGKVALNGFKRAWNKGSDAEYAYMAKNGFLSQEVSDFQRAFNSVEDKSSFGKFMTGDPASSNKFAQKGLVGWASILTDKSEDFSRSWGHMIGLEVADMMGISDRVGAHNFAHDIANKMIANYSPANRPEIFQGAIGSTVGLFQSFMWAYYQRMFRYVETGDKAALGTQYALQGTLYGAQTVPGWSELNNMFFEHSNGEESPYDSMTRNFGHSGGDMLMTGVLSNLPKLFGVDGVNLYSRGDVTPRVPQSPADAITKSAAVSMFTKVAGGIAQAAQLFSQSNPDLNKQQVGEVLSNMIPNRPIAGMIEQLLAGGADTDSHGQLVAQTKTWMDATYRMLGLRSMTQAKQLEAFYANKQAQEIQAARTDQYNIKIRGSIRNGDLDSMPDYVNQYLEQGGDPRQVRRMLRDAYTSATQTRAQRQLSTVMHSAGKTEMTQRLLDARVSITDEANTGSIEDAYGMNDPLNGSQPQSSEGQNSMAYGLNQ